MFLVLKKVIKNFPKGKKIIFKTVDSTNAGRGKLIDLMTDRLTDTADTELLMMF